MRNYLSLLFLFFFLSLIPNTAMSATCGGRCDNQSDCDNTCTYCDTTLPQSSPSSAGTCVSCCNFDVNSCPTSGGAFCDPAGPGGCKNLDNAVCISEVPKQSKSWLIIGFGLLAMLLSGGALGYKKVRSTKRPS